MTTTAEAVYENGAVHLIEPLELAEGEHVQVVKTAIDALAKLGPPPDPLEVAQILAEIAALSVDTGEPETASRDHDKFLYGPEGAR